MRLIDINGWQRVPVDLSQLIRRRRAPEAILIL